MRTTVFVAAMLMSASAIQMQPKPATQPAPFKKPTIEVPKIKTGV